MSLDPSSPFVAPDPTTAFIGASCLDFLLIELVPLAHRITNHLDNAPVPIPTPASATSTGTSVAGPGTRRLDDDEERDATHRRLEALGYRVGQGLVERFVFLQEKEMIKKSSVETVFFSGLGKRLIG